jgi:hypothetical protein
MPPTQAYGHVLSPPTWAQGHLLSPPTRAHGHLLSPKLLLLHHKASTDVQDNDGSTPLHLACARGHEDVSGQIAVLTSFMPCSVFGIVRASGVSFFQLKNC